MMTCAILLEKDFNCIHWGSQVGRKVDERANCPTGVFLHAHALVKLQRNYWIVYLFF